MWPLLQVATHQLVYYCGAARGGFVNPNVEVFTSIGSTQVRDASHGNKW